MKVWANARDVALMLIGAVAFAGWQYQSYRHERALIDESLHEQAHSIINAMVGGISSHRRLGYGLEDQLQGMLDELVSSEDVVAAAFAAPQSDTAVSAGTANVLALSDPIEAGYALLPAGYRMVKKFHLAPAPRGGGFGRGFGRGRNRAEEGSGAFASEGDYWAAVLLDRARTDLLKRRSAQSHLFTTVAGVLVIGLVGLAWRSSMQALESKSRARILETEAKHLRDLSQAAAGLAHETRNPLGLIRGWTQRLAQTDIDEATRAEQTRAVIEECDRVTARINQFLNYAKPLAPQLAKVQLQPLVEELAGLLQPDFEARQLRLEQRLDSQCDTIEADRELLRQALFNLLQNAVQFSPPGGVVTIECRPGPDETCALRILDQGPGVPEELLDSLFTPYVTSRADGTGLGLAIVKKIASLLDWQVRYDPRANGGSIFTLAGIHA